MLGFPGVPRVVAVGMTVNEITGPVAFDESAKDLKSVMAEVGFIMNAERRGVGDEDVDRAFMEECIAE